MTGNLGQSKLAGRSESAVAGNDGACFVDQERIAKPERLYACDDLTNLFLRMGAGISWIGFDLIKRFHQQLHRAAPSLARRYAGARGWFECCFVGELRLGERCG